MVVVDWSSISLPRIGDVLKMRGRSWLTSVKWQNCEFVFQSQCRMQEKWKYRLKLGQAIKTKLLLRFDISCKSPANCPWHSRQHWWEGNTVGIGGLTPLQCGYCGYTVSIVGTCGCWYPTDDEWQPSKLPDHTYSNTFINPPLSLVWHFLKWSCSDIYGSCFKKSLNTCMRN